MVNTASSAQKKKIIKKVGTGAAKVMRKIAKAPTKAELQKRKAVHARKRVKALVQHLTPKERKTAIKNLQKRKAARKKRA